jgi:shikimate dehydrogenase
VKKAAVIGHPISHSLSPAVFQFLKSQCHVAGASPFDLQYVTLDVLPPDLVATLTRLSRDADWIGLNITLPHKESVMALMAGLSQDAQLTGAVNVIGFENGKMHGYNTDVHGISQTLLEHRVDLTNKNALVIGAGGAARAACLSLIRAGVREVLILNRSPSRAQLMMESLQRATSALGQETKFHISIAGDETQTDEPQSALQFAIAIQATPMGMQGFQDNEEFFSRAGVWQRLTPGAVALDLIYRPEHTIFLRLAKERGFRCLGGLDMFAHQALETWRIWFGAEALPADIKSSLVDLLRRELEKSS